MWNNASLECLYVVTVDNTSAYVRSLVFDKSQVTQRRLFDLYKSLSLHARANTVSCYSCVFCFCLLCTNCARHDKAPRYLANLCIPVTSVEGRRQLRSATTGTLLLPRVRTSTGQRSFTVFGPATSNSLPPSLRAPELSLSTFKRLLKSQLFQHA